MLVFAISRYEAWCKQIIWGFCSGAFVVTEVMNEYLLNAYYGTALHLCK